MSLRLTPTRKSSVSQTKGRTNHAIARQTGPAATAQQLQRQIGNQGTQCLLQAIVNPRASAQRRAIETEEVLQGQFTTSATSASTVQREVDPTYRSRLEQMSDQDLNQESLDVETALNDAAVLSQQWSDLAEQRGIIFDELARRGFPPSAPGARGRTILGYAKGGPAGGRFPIRAHFFEGRTAQRALVIGGVHGSEQSGVEVANLLIDNLLNGPKPHSRLSWCRFFSQLTSQLPKRRLRESIATLAPVG